MLIYNTLHIIIVLMPLMGDLGKILLLLVIFLVISVRVNNKSKQYIVKHEECV